MSRKTWADLQGLPTGVEGEIVNGITVSDSRRVTEYAERRADIELLVKIKNSNYRSKGVNAVVFGIDKGEGRMCYAVYVEDSFKIYKVEAED
jgi:hypothetical protein